MTHRTPPRLSAHAETAPIVLSMVMLETLLSIEGKLSTRDAAT